MMYEFTNQVLWQVILNVALPGAAISILLGIASYIGHRKARRNDAAVPFWASMLLGVAVGPMFPMMLLVTAWVMYRLGLS